VIKNANILVIGANSFLGQNLLKDLRLSFEGVFATTRHIDSENNFNTSFNEIEYLPLHIENIENYNSLPLKVNTVIHLAAESSNQKSISSLFQSNLVGIHNLISYARRAKAQKFIFASSMSVYGQVSDEVVNSKTPIVDPELYGQSKRLGELYLLDAAKDFKSISLRLPGMLGEGAKGHWLSNILSKAQNNQDINIFNPDAKYNNAVSTNCLNNFLIHLYESDWQESVALPLASSGITTIRKAVEIVIKISGSESKIFTKPHRNHSFSIDCSEAHEYGFNPKHIEEALIEYARPLK
jgi:nucleoside-diphosphate-sugar epimerase